jgi:hypothetical protein
MNHRVVFTSFVALAACALINGCASIISGRHADVAFDTYPTSAHVTVHDDDGRAVATLDTPGVVSLKRNRRFFLPARYTATIEAPGYAPTTVPIRSTVNPWILGNIIIGGIPGLVVDNATGAAWQPRQSEIHRQLAPLGGPGPELLYSGNQPPPSSTEPAPEVAAQPGNTVTR